MSNWVNKPNKPRYGSRDDRRVHGDFVTYTQEEVEFMNVMSREQKDAGRFLTYAEVLRTAKRMGYKKKLKES